MSQAGIKKVGKTRTRLKNIVTIQMTIHNLLSFFSIFDSPATSPILFNGFYKMERIDATLITKR